MAFPLSAHVHTFLSHLFCDDFSDDSKRGLQKIVCNVLYCFVMYSSNWVLRFKCVILFWMILVMI